MTLRGKTLVELYVPASRQSWDVWLPDKARLGEVFSLVGSLSNELSSGLYHAHEGMVLCDCDTGLIYDASDRVREAGLVNGSRLMLL